MVCQKNDQTGVERVALCLSEPLVGSEETFVKIVSIDEIWMKLQITHAVCPKAADIALLMALASNSVHLAAIY